MFETFESYIYKTILEAKEEENHPDITVLKSYEDLYKNNSEFFSMNNAEKKRSILNIDIPNSVVEIKEDAFRGLPKLRIAEIPDSVRKIGAYAFAECPELTKIILPKSLKELPKYCFWKCKSLVASTKNAENPFLPPTLEKIGKSCFLGCTSLEEIEIPDSVFEIGENAFARCKKLKNIKLSESLRKLRSGILSETGIESLKIPKSISLRNFEDDAFSKCEKLKTLILPDKLKNKIEIRFGSRFASVYLKDTAKVIGSFRPNYSNNSSPIQIEYY